MSERLVVIGGNAGGMTAASGARRRRPDLEIVAFERGTHTSYAACGIPFFVGGEVDDLESLVARRPDVFRHRYDIDVRLRHEVTAVDLDARRVTARDLDSGGEVVAVFDHLMIGTGARPLRPPLPGIDGPRVLGVQTLDDAPRLLQAATEDRCDDVVVVGAGYIGLEMAEAFRHRGSRVVVVDVADQVMRTLDSDMASLVADAMARNDIEIRLGVTITGFEPGRVVTTDGSLKADVVVLGLGVTPNSELARDAGIELGVRNAIRVDPRQQTNVAGVWAAGDCCTSIQRVTGEQTYVALGTVTNRQSRVAGINIGGGDATFPGVLGTAVTKVCATEVGRTGLTVAEATAAGLDVETATIESTTRTRYYPQTAPITVKLVAESGSGRLLGGQIVGGPGSAKRIDTVATALWAGMDAVELIDVDLAYAPPFSPVWDPVATAARQLA